LENYKIIFLYLGILNAESSNRVGCYALSTGKQLQTPRKNVVNYTYLPVDES